MGLEEAFESPAFYILGGGGVICEVIGFILAKQMGTPWSLWMFGALVIGTLVAAAFFATRG